MSTLTQYDRAAEIAAKKQASNNIRKIYEQEVPIHGVIDKVAKQVDAEFFEAAKTDPKLATKAAGMTLEENKDVRHAAVRFALPEEVEFFVRSMNLLNAFPVGMYDLTPEGTPVKSVVIRPHTDQDIKEDGFRVFCSMLDPESIKYKSEADKQLVYHTLEKRREDHFKGEACFSNRLFELVAIGETQGFTKEERAEFVAEISDAFRLNQTIMVPKAAYEKFKEMDPIVADVLGPGLNLNHTTPNTEDIEKLYARASKETNPMTGEQLVMNGFVYGPKGVDILLEQSSCKAVLNNLKDPNGEEVVLRTRFCEFEQRHQPVTRTGREIYDTNLAEIMVEVKALKEKLKGELEAGGGKYEGAPRDKIERQMGELYNKLAYERFPKVYPDNDRDMALQGLVYYKYEIDEQALAANKDKVQQILNDTKANELKFTAEESQCQRTIAQQANPVMEALVEAGVAKRIRMIYHDFLPASASGIFGSNKDKDGDTVKTENGIFKWMKENLGVTDFYDLYENAQAKKLISAIETLAKSGVDVSAFKSKVGAAIEDALSRGDSEKIIENHRQNIIPALAEKFDRDRAEVLSKAPNGNGLKTGGLKVEEGPDREAAQGIA